MGSSGHFQIVDGFQRFYNVYDSKCVFLYELVQACVN
jgi:hypothetical protein